jgi:hypothetical protein
MVIEVSEVALAKAEKLIDVTPLGMVMEVSEAAYAKAPTPIDVTLLGMVIEVSEAAFMKACSRIDVTLLGMVMEVSEVAFSKAKAPIDVAPLGITATPEQVDPWVTTPSMTVKLPVVQDTSVPVACAGVAKNAKSSAVTARVPKVVCLICFSLASVRGCINETPLLQGYSRQKNSPYF